MAVENVIDKIKASNRISSPKVKGFIAMVAVKVVAVIVRIRRDNIIYNLESWTHLLVSKAKVHHTLVYIRSSSVNT